MVNRISDIVRFQDERLFNGAVSLDWCLDDPDRAREAVSAFVFHGPTYHGVTQDDIGDGHGHRLRDTASFTHSIVQSCAGLSETPFTLAIAGYGTGKSHLALTLSELLGNPDNGAANAALDSLKIADEPIANDIKKLIQGMGKPCLVLSLNGMRNFDLTAEVSKQVLAQVRKHNADTGPMDNLRPRFSEAASRVKIMASSQELGQELLACTDLDSIDKILSNLELQDEKTYNALYPLFEQKGLRIPVHGGESLKDIFDVACREYCGTSPDKPFSSILVLFDEFGRYAEFATMKRQIAGSGVLQHLFEGIQSNSDKVSFIGFIQFELNSYVQRIAPEFKNDIIRVTTRYQNADKSYLSTNLETLIAHLIDKKTSDIDNWFSNNRSCQNSENVMETINKWFPLSLQHHLWCDSEQFHTVIRKGCWPLSPYAVWLLYYLSSAGRHLQERSALSLLSNCMKRHQERPAEINGQPNELATTDLWSEELLQEFIASEESGQQGTIAHSYATAFNKHGNRLDPSQNTLLQAIVIAAKLGLTSTDRDEAVLALSCLSGIPLPETQDALETLQDEYNVIEWDKNFQTFDILGDAVPRTQFLAFLRQRVASGFDQQGKADLFSSHIFRWCDTISGIDCDFSEANEISTKEWGYQYATSNLVTLPNHIELAAENWRKALAVNDKRGTVIYCYVGPDQDVEEIENDTARLLRYSAKSMGQTCLPIFVVLIVDETADIGRMMAELAVLTDSISEQDKGRFGNLIGSHQEKTHQQLARSIDDAVKKRLYITGLRESLDARRLGALGTELFSKIYKKPLPFPFDGYSTKGGNAAASCQQLTIELLDGRLDHQSCSSKPAKDRNRALHILNQTWDCFNKTTGKISIPKNTIAHKLVMAWRKKLDADDQQFKIADELLSACLPPYGANLASIGMLFGVFLAPRRDNIFIITDDGNQLDVGQWLRKDLFNGKVIDLNKIANAEIINIGEVSAEWDRLLEDWEQAEMHHDRFQFYRQALELKARVSTPPTLTYKYIHLEEIAKKSIFVLAEVEKKQKEAWDYIDKGEQYKDASKAIRGASSLAKLLKKMEDEMNDWTNDERSTIENEVGRARQFVIELFPEWLTSQTLRTDNPEKVGKFNHFLGSLVYNNLLLLNLVDEAELLKERVDEQVRSSQVQAEASRLIQEVDSWLTGHGEVFRIIRIAQIRALRIPGKEFAKKLQGLARRVSLPELNDIRMRISSFITNLTKAESNLSKKANRLWDSRILAYSDLEPLIQNVTELMQTYEGCDADLKDLRAMQKILAIYQDCYNRLCDLNLTWEKFESLVIDLKSEAVARYGNEDSPPWDIHKTLDVFVKEVSKKRKVAGKEWLSILEAEKGAIDEMGVEDADNLLRRAQKPSPLLTPQQCKSADRIARKAEQRCQELEVDWLIQRFKKLPESARNIFLKRIGEKPR